MIMKFQKGSTGDLDKNFSCYEFDCNGSGCCSETRVDLELVKILQKIRDHFGKPVNISSGYRCPVYNAGIANASQKSKHMEGTAADIYISGVNPSEIAKYAESIGVLGIGLYDTFVHIDTRTKKAFWYGHQQESRETFGGSVQKPVETVDSCPTAGLHMLYEGCESDSVYALQVLLAGYGYLRGMYVNGTFGEETDTAVKDYQREHDLTVDGICGSQTWGKLLGV